MPKLTAENVSHMFCNMNGGISHSNACHNFTFNCRGVGDLTGTVKNGCYHTEKIIRALVWTIIHFHHVLGNCAILFFY